jgi:hypothetical protein
MTREPHELLPPRNEPESAIWERTDAVADALGEAIREWTKPLWWEFIRLTAELKALRYAMENLGLDEDRLYQARMRSIEDLRSGSEYQRPVFHDALEEYAATVLEKERTRPKGKPTDDLDRS